MPALLDDATCIPAATPSACEPQERAQTIASQVFRACISALGLIAVAVTGAITHLNRPSRQKMVRMNEKLLIHLPLNSSELPIRSFMVDEIIKLPEPH